MSKKDYYEYLEEIKKTRPKILNPKLRILIKTVLVVIGLLITITYEKHLVNPIYFPKIQNHIFLI